MFGPAATRALEWQDIMRRAKGEAMKNTKVCPKCKSPDVLVDPPTRYSMGKEIRVGRIQVTLTRYVCLGCGYIEEWVDSPELLQKLKEEHALPPWKK